MPESLLELAASLYRERLDLLTDSDLQAECKARNLSFGEINSLNRQDVISSLVHTHVSPGFPEAPGTACFRYEPVAVARWFISFAVANPNASTTDAARVLRDSTLEWLKSEAYMLAAINLSCDDAALEEMLAED
jgi:hypothetical protein